LLPLAGAGVRTRGLGGGGQYERGGHRAAGTNFRKRTGGGLFDRLIPDSNE